MTLGELIDRLGALHAAGVPLDTPIVVPSLDENADDDEDMLNYEVLSADVYGQINYCVDNSPKMSVCWRTDTAVVLSTLGNDCWQNSVHYRDHKSHEMVEANTAAEYLSGTSTIQKAKLWDGLLASPAIRILGTSGCQHDGKPYAHFGMEIWTHHSPCYNNEYGQQCITAYAAKMVQNLEDQAKIKFTVTNPEIEGEITGATFEGDNLCMSILPEYLFDFRDRVESLGMETAVRELAVSHGISVDATVTLKVDRKPLKVTIVRTDRDDIVDWVVKSDDAEISLLVHNYNIYACLERKLFDEMQGPCEELAKLRNLSGNVTIEPIFFAGE